MTFDYGRYLAAKTTVDDRALNRHVLAELCRLLPAGEPRVLEVGAVRGLAALAAVWVQITQPHGPAILALAVPRLHS